MIVLAVVCTILGGILGAFLEPYRPGEFTTLLAISKRNSGSPLFLFLFAIPNRCAILSMM